MKRILKAAAALAASIAFAACLSPAAFADEAIPLTADPAYGQTLEESWWGDVEANGKFSVTLTDLPATIDDYYFDLDDKIVLNGKTEESYAEWENFDASTGKLDIHVYGPGKHVVTINAEFEVPIYDEDWDEYDWTYVTKQYVVSFEVIPAELSQASIVSCPGKTHTLKASATLGKVTWKSSKTSVATVSSAGKVTVKGKGRCTISVSKNGVKQTCVIESTSKKAYKAVKNALKDYKTKITYSQGKRMGKKYRDCSSFVSRCYWDSKLGRKIYAIGGSGAKSWALNAAAQAKWLNKKGKRVAYKAVPVSKLRPGDTIYYETDYAGRNKQYRHIDHAAIYIGGGMCLNTGHTGEYGSISYRYYYEGDTSIKFIGRPCK